MSFNLSYLVPISLRKSMLCCTRVNSMVENSAPDITTCHSNGYIYEIKNRKVMSSLNVGGEKASSISCYYLRENQTFVIFYLLFTVSNKLLVVKKFDKRLQIVRIYDEVKEFEVFDFKCVGYPQIMISFLNSNECLVEFPVEQVEKFDVDEALEFSSSSNLISDSLEEKLQIVNKHIDQLTEEYESLRKICNSSENKGCGMVPVGCVKFSSFIGFSQPKLISVSKWYKVFGKSLIIGMRVVNAGSLTVRDLELTVRHKDVQQFSCRFFPSFAGIPDDLLSCPVASSPFLNPGEDLFVVGAFSVPKFFPESDVSLPCYLTSSDRSRHVLRETFRLNVLDVAAQHSRLLEDRFTAEDWMSVLTVKSETELRLETEGAEEGALESVLQQMGFDRIKHVKDKLFYCTSTYLHQVFVAWRPIALNPTVWKIRLHTSDELEIYFFVNALYELLPENTTVSIDGK